MSYSAGSRSQAARSPLLRPEGPRHSTWPQGQAQQHRDGEDEVRALQEALDRIQQSVAGIRKETTLLFSAAKSSVGGQQRVQDIMESAKGARDSAKRLLDGLSGAAGGGSLSEQNHRRLTVEKLSENFEGSSMSLELAMRAYESAEADRERRDAKAAAVRASSPASSAGAGKHLRGSGVELHQIEVRASSPAASSAGAGKHLRGSGVQLHQNEDGGRQQQQLHQLDVLDATEAELEVHRDIVDEYVADISTLQRNIKHLQGAMVDLAQHAQSQGEVLDNIESNMARASSTTECATEELTQASQLNQRGTKLVCWLMILAAIMAGIVILVVVLESRKHDQ